MSCVLDSLVTGSCYRLLENPNAVKTKGTRDYIFHLIGLMIKKYNHGLGEICNVARIKKLDRFQVENYAGYANDISSSGIFA